jgi:hypothetical protein
MKNHFLCLLILLMSITSLFAQHTYLTNQCEVLGNTHNRCKIYKYNGSSSSKLEMAGGEVGYGGFGLWGEGSYVTFSLKGQYETLQFTVGPLITDDAANGRGWVTVLGDNKILYEYEIEQDHIAKQVTLNVEGVHKLTFASEQAHGSQVGGVVDAWVYPKGQAPTATSQEVADVVDPRLKSLPDVCKLISNIPPYSLRSNVDKQLYDGKSDYVTFSMGGTKFSEGFI